MIRVTRLDDLLAPLLHGVWEVVVEKSTVTEPLDSGWKRSTLNVPSPGTIASYRKGRYHVHETRTEWRVHLDRHDPETHPLLHLADDAPLLLMIGDTCGTLITHIREASGTRPRDILEEQRVSWQRQVLLGFVFFCAGFLIASNPIGFLNGVTQLVIPPLLLCLGAVIAWKGFHTHAGDASGGSVDTEEVVQGIAICGTGIISFSLPLLVWSLAILAVLGVWALGSAVILLVPILRHRAGISEGFWSRCITGVLSLVLVVAFVFMPRESVMLLVTALGMIAVLLGVMFIVNGWRLRQWMVTPVSV